MYALKVADNEKFKNGFVINLYFSITLLLFGKYFVIT